MSIDYYSLQQSDDVSMYGTFLLVANLSTYAYDNKTFLSN